MNKNFYFLNEKFSKHTTTNNNINLVDTEALDKGLSQINDSIPNVDKSAIKDQINSFRDLNKDSIYTKAELEKNKLEKVFMNKQK